MTPKLPSYEDHQHLRTVRFSPYRRGIGMPTFTLRMWDTYRIDQRDWRVGKSVLGYELRMHAHPTNPTGRTVTTVLFTGEDMYCSPMIAIDSDESVNSLMGFLTLKPGDTDDEHFANYTPEQMEFAESYAEYLGFEVYCRFDPDGKKGER
jgi:hypothetical protein